MWSLTSGTMKSPLKSTTSGFDEMLQHLQAVLDNNGAMTKYYL